jgi:uncharacterized protein YqgC (DUF456 family)
METTIAIIAVICGLVGIIGSIIPALPGPPVSWAGMLMLYFWGGTNAAGESMSSTLLFTMLAITAVVQVVDYIVPIYFTKLGGGSRHAARGAMVGLIARCLLTPIGMILGSFLGALLAELYWGGKQFNEALKSALASFAGFIAGTGIKVMVSVVMFYYIIVYL